MKQANPEVALAEEIAQYYDDPLGFVLFAYPWGQSGPLKDATGPDAWQKELLEDIGRAVRERGFDGVHAVAPLRFAIASGHGIGKSTIAAWLVNWIMSTRPYSVGTVTANTFVQLSSKTWASIQTWTKRSITAHWFVITGERIFYKGHKDNWFANAQTCREENSESFAGQHAASSSSWYLFDEGSAVPDKIFEVAEGGLTDGESMIFVLGNPTRNQGKFHRIVFGSERNTWNSRSIDSRSAALTNKTQIADWVAQYGEDSDFVRVRVRGLPPAASDLQFIDQTRIYEAQKREALYLPDDPLVVGVDVARGGGDRCVIRFRRGLDARTIPAIVIPGEQARDSMLLVSKLSEVLNTSYGGVKPAIAFVDGSGIGGPIIDRVKQLGFKNVVEIQFGAGAPDHHYANMRVWMWAKLKDWLVRGAIDTLDQLEIDLTGPGYHHNRSDQLVLESKEDMKKRGLDSPDHGDALALTFARPVIAQPKPAAGSARAFTGSGGWMG